MPIRYGRMLVSPFTFYRGAAAVMAADLAATPDSGIVVQACGDAHISNFGGFAAPDRRLIFSPNDFDETLPGPWEWDVKRMAASAEIAGRDVGLPAERRRWIVTDCVREYREAMRALRRREPPRRLVRAPERERARRALRRQARARRTGSCSPSRSRRARRKTSLRAVEKLTERVDGELRFRSVPPLLVPLRELFEATDGRDETEYVRELLDAVRGGPRPRSPLSVRHLPLRGHGPQGRRRRQRRHARLGVPARGPRAAGIRWCCRPRRRRRRCSSPISARASSPTTASGSCRASACRRPRATSSSSWQRSRGLDGDEHDFYVRQLWDWKASADLSTMAESGLHAYTRACGWSLARMHARSGDRLAIAAYLGGGPELRPRDRALLRGLRRPERARPPAAGRSGRPRGEVAAELGV